MATIHKRYLHNIPHRQNELEKILKDMNNQHHKIQFTPNTGAATNTSHIYYTFMYYYMISLLVKEHYQL